MFPIADDRGRTIGFGGRVLTQSQGPKYLNSDETRLFVKRRVLYGIDQARSSIKKREHAVLVEGYMDVVTAHQFGFTQTVAALGTAFSIDHAQVLSRLTTAVVVAFDQDEAGAQAVDRVYDACSHQSFSIRVAQLSAKDPADVLIERGKEEFEDQIDNAVSYIQFKFKRLLEAFPPTKIENVSKIVGVISPMIRREPDPIVQRHYVKRIAGILKVDPEIILAKVAQFGYAGGSKRLYIQSKQKLSKYQIAEEMLLFSMAAQGPDRANIINQVQVDWFFSPEFKDLVAVVSNVLLQNPNLTDAELIHRLETEEHRSMLGRILVERADDSRSSWVEYANLLQWRDMEYRYKELYSVVDNETFPENARAQIHERLDAVKQRMREIEHTSPSDGVHVILSDLDEIRRQIQEIS